MVHALFVSRKTHPALKSFWRLKAETTAPDSAGEPPPPVLWEGSSSDEDEEQDMDEGGDGRRSTKEGVAEAQQQLAAALELVSASQALLAERTAEAELERTRGLLQAVRLSPP